MPIATAHGEGRAESTGTGVTVRRCSAAPTSTTRVRDRDLPAESNGSPQGATGFTTRRPLHILMPHPERVFARCSSPASRAGGTALAAHVPQREVLVG